MEKWKGGASEDDKDNLGTNSNFRKSLEHSFRIGFSYSRRHGLALLFFFFTLLSRPVFQISYSSWQGLRSLTANCFQKKTSAMKGST